MDSPSGVKQRLSEGNSVAYSKNNIVCIGWQDKKNIILLSTEGSAKMETHTSNRNQDHTSLQLVCEYDLHMGGVYLHDMRTYLFLHERDFEMEQKSAFCFVWKSFVE